MERERERVAAEEEVETAAEDVSGGLEVRRRRGRTGGMGGEDKGAPPEAEEESGGGVEQRSVYVDGDQGVWKCRHCIWTYQLSGPGINHIQKQEGYCQLVMDVETLTRLGTYFDSPIKGIEFCDEVAGEREADQIIDEKHKSLENGKADFGTKESNNQENVPVHEEVQSLKNVRLENGSYSHLSSEKCSENGITGSNLEIEESVQVRLVKKSKLEVAEFDLERVLDEQDTHDLYCPNCNSCITKRVILRKRKRTVPEIHYDAPPAKVQQVQHDPDATTPLAEVTELGHQWKLFRCLSCFSFFIPEEGGFNIFRIFGKREESENLQTSQQLPVNNMSGISSIVKPATTIKNGSDTEVQARLPGEPYASIVEQTDDPSSRDKHNALAQSLPGDMIHGNLQTFIKEKPDNAILHNDSGTPLPREAMFNFGEQREDAAHLYEYSTTTTSISGVIVHEGHKDIGQKINDVFEKNDAEIPAHLPGEPYASIVEQTNDPSSRDKYNSLAQSLPGDMVHGNLQTKIREKLDNAILNNDAGIPLPREDMFNLGEQGEDAVHSYKYSTTTTSISEVIVHEGQNDIGQNINDAFKKNDAGEDIIKPVRMVKPAFPEGTSQIIPNILASATPAIVVLPPGETQIYIGGQSAQETGRNNDWDVLKSIVYGGLIESITSLGVVSSAAGTDATTLNIVALGLANLIGGLFVIAHDLSELRSARDEYADQNTEPIGRYWESLGRKRNFRLHATVAVLAYMVAGLLPPVIYGFSFWKSDNKEYKLIAVAAASLVCIALLAIGKAYVQPQKPYIKSLSYYLVLGVSGSGLSYVAGVMIDRLLNQLGLFDGSAATPAPPSIMYRDVGSILGTWSSS